MQFSTSALENWLLHSFASATGSADMTVLRGLVRAVAPSATSWGIEIDSRMPHATPAFGCSLSTPFSGWPAALSGTRSARALRDILDDDHVDGRWFFEFDPGVDASFRGEAHTFARLKPGARTRTIAEEILTKAVRVSDLPELIGPAEALVAALGQGGRVTDLGVVIRESRAELRMGITVPMCELAAVPILAVNSQFRDVTCAILDRCSSHAMCTLQVRLGGNDGRHCVLTGVEIATSERGWPHVVDAFIAHGALKAESARVVLDWPKSMALSRVGRAWPVTVLCAVSHLKLQPTGATKIYLAAAESFSVFA